MHSRVKEACFLAGDVKKLVDDIGALKPTLFLGVPRVFDRIYAGVMDQINKAGTLPASAAGLTIDSAVQSRMNRIRGPF